MLGTKNVWLVGGEKVIPASVEAAIKGDGYSVTRINGSDRYETAKLIAEAGAKIAGKQPSKVFVASGTSFADALAVSPVAYAKGYAIALTEKDSTSDFTKKELGNIGTDNKILVGGTAVVSDKVKADLSITTRVAGDDRAVTANLVSDWAKKSEGFSVANAALVGGTNGNGADSLVASALLGKSSTTLHFAGWDATNVYLKDHSAELTGKGLVFGGKAAVPGDQVDKAQAAAQTTAAVSAFIVTATDTNKVSWADTVQGKVVTATYSSSDTFQVDGKPATYASFTTQVAKGDTIWVSKDAAGKTTYSLTNVLTSAYVKGVVTNLTVPSTLATSVTIGEAISGVDLNTINLGGAYQIYTVDGASVSQTVFTQALNKGDSVEVSGTGADVSHVQTVALTNAKVSGTVSGLSGGAFKISPASGIAALGNFTAISSDALTVDGKTVVLADFTKALSNGDSVTYSYSGGVQTIALVNAAPNVSGGQALLVGGKAAEVTAGVVTAFHYVDAKGVAQDPTFGAAVAAADINKGADSPVVGDGTHAEKFTFRLPANFHAADYQPNLRIAFGSGTAGDVADNAVWNLTMPAPAAGATTTTYAAALATSLTTQVQALGTGTAYTSASVAVSSAGVVSVTFGANGAQNDPTAVVGYNVQPKLFIDGRSAVASELAAGLTVGDTVKYQGADDATKTLAMLDVTTASFGGVVKSFSGSTVVIAAADGTTTLGSANVDGSGSVATTAIGGGTALTGTATFIINGDTKDVTAMTNALSAINSKTLAGSLTITVDGTKLVYNLTTKLA